MGAGVTQARHCSLENRTPLNQVASGVYRPTMRVWTLFFLLAASPAQAQPGAPSFCFVLAEDRPLLRPLSHAASVMQHYRERVKHAGWEGSWLKPEEVLPLQGGPLFRDSLERWTLYRPLEHMAASYLLITVGPDTMRIDLPERDTLLWQQALSRVGGRDSPEVIRFRAGRYAMEQLAMARWEMRAAQRLHVRVVDAERAEVQRSQGEREALRREQERRWAFEREAALRTPPPAPSAEEIEREIAQRPGLQQAALQRVSTDTVWLRVTARVLLDGGCASAMPLFGIEVLTGTGWAVRLPMRHVQMACGMPEADWKDRLVMLPPLRWWVAAHQPAPTKDLKPGTYRIVLSGANRKELQTAAFTLP